MALLFRVDDEMRKTVEELAAQGVSQQLIGLRIGARSPKTLRKHFRKELDSAGIEANRRVARTLFEMATDGKNTTATIFWLKCRGRWGNTMDTGLFDGESTLEFVPE
jgi:hypothetical protein